MRIATRAVIIENEKILLCKYEDKNGFFYVCPGGGQEENEDMITNVKRECFEELSIDVDVIAPAFFRETCFSFEEKIIHQIEHYFYCKIKGNEIAKSGNNVDYTCVGFEWVSLNKLADYPTFPTNLGEILHNKKCTFANDCQW